MNPKIVLAALLLITGLSACNRKDEIESPKPVVQEPTLAEQAQKYANEHLDIQASEVVHVFPKSVKVSIGNIATYNHSFEYDNQKRLVAILNERGAYFTVTFNPNAQNANSKIDTQDITFQLNQEGMATTGKGIALNGKETEIQYFYKNKYLVSMTDKLYVTQLKYNNTGDLLEWNGVNHRGEKTIAVRLRKKA